MTTVLRILQIASYVAGGLLIAAVIVVAVVCLFALLVEKTFGQGGR